jgi:hypothetical protein
MKNVIKEAWNNLFGQTAPSTEPEQSAQGQLPPYDDQSRDTGFLLADPTQSYIEAKVRFAQSVLERAEGGKL